MNRTARSVRQKLVRQKPENAQQPVLERAAAVTVSGHQVGRIVGLRNAEWLVDYPDNPHGPLLARTTVQADAAAMQRAADEGSEALLVFERERSDLPIVVGLLAPPAPAESASRRLPAAVLDGDRLVYTAEKEILLRCGDASIQLLSDGTVRIRGTNVLSRASATNRIRGGHVQIN